MRSRPIAEKHQIAIESTNRNNYQCKPFVDSVMVEPKAIIQRRFQKSDTVITRIGVSQIDITPDDTEITSWLVALLAAYPPQITPPSRQTEIQTRKTRERLKYIEFPKILLAIERHGAAPGHAEIGLYQDWIAAAEPGNPHLFAAWFNLGVVFARTGDLNRAVIAYGNANKLNPAFAPAMINLGLSLESLGQNDAALQTWENGLQTDETRTSLLNHRARLMERLGRLGEAEAILRISLLTNPIQPDAVQHWVHIRQKTCNWPVLTPGIPGLSPDELLRQCGPLAVLALTDDVPLQREITAEWIGRKIPPAPTRLSPAQGYRHDRIRIGYLSSDFCRHPMSYLIAELFERHDRSRFEVFGYCSTIEDGSDIRRRVLASFEHHRLIRELPDEPAAKLIRNDEIDILIELNGLTAHTRLPLLRWRPAPIQATYLGFIGPVPLPELDYLLCDDFVIPPHHAAAYRPTPLPIARTYQVNDSKRAIGAPLSRREVGLPEHGFVLCCFSNYYKITETMFGAWMTILRQAPETVLWLTADDAGAQARLRHSAVQAGIAPERLLFVERTTPELYMSRLGLADLFLDTFPYNAGTVASDAIRMQLPLLTLCGASFASRMAGSLLQTIGAPAGIVTTLEDYITTATNFATDERAYAEYKRCFTLASWSTTIGDIAAFTAEFEQTLERLKPDTPATA